MKHFPVNSLLFAMLLLSQLSWGQIKLGEFPEEIDPAALLELKSTTQGLLLARMNTAQRDALPMQTNPVGLMIYNTDIHEIQYLIEATETNAKGEKRRVLRWENANDSAIPLTRPNNPTTGRLFYDLMDQKLSLWDGNQWIPVGNAVNSGGSSPTLRFQTLSLEGHQLHISNGNTVDLSALVTTTSSPVAQAPNQLLSISALSSSNNLTFAISGGNTITLDLSPLAAAAPLPPSIANLTFNSQTSSLTIGNSNAASQTISLATLGSTAINGALSIVSSGTVGYRLPLDGGKNGEIIQMLDANSGTTTWTSLPTQPLQNIDAFNFDSNTNSLTLGITGGNTQSVNLSTVGSITVSGALIVANTTTTSYTLPKGKGDNGQVLSMLDANSGTTTWTSLLGGSGLFTTSGNTIHSRQGTTTLDFVIGSDQLENRTGSNDDTRLFFDKSKGAFRAGHASGTTWNDANIGDRSLAFGFNTRASGDRSTAFGNATEALSYAESVLGSYNTTPVPNSTTVWRADDRLLVIGNGNSAANRSDALVILKNGDTTLDGNFTLTEGNALIVAGVQPVPDYVFEHYFQGESGFNPNYRFPSLQEVEHFIKANNHLPGAQSRALIQANGKWDVSKNVHSNLEKIEELYLHTIQQQKEIEELKALVHSLKAKLK